MAVTRLALAVAAVLLTGCASTVNGTGSGGPSAVSSGSSGSFGSSGPPSSSLPPSSSAPAGNCGGAQFCDEFSDSKSGWPSEQEPHFYADYDTYLGGSYHMGERADRTVWEDAPVKVSSLAPDFGIRATVDATPGPTMPHDTWAGFVCWEHTAQDGESASAFLFEVDGTTAEVGVWSDRDGVYTSIQSKDTTVFVFGGTANHLGISCTKSGTAAHLTMSVNGQDLLDATYATGHVPWKVGDGVGLVAGGKGSDIFYDNFGVSPA
jgi:hypothetical protein